MSNTDTVLEVRNLTRRFGGVAAVQDLAFDLVDGEVLGVIGPNGAGKSTLMALLSGGLAPTHGEVFFDGRDVSRVGAALRARRGLARTFQIPRPFAGLTVRQNLEIAHQHRFDDRFGSVDVVLEFCGLAARAHVPSEELTHADQRRLEFARALVTGPKVMLLDELGAGLIASEVEEFASLIRQVQSRGTTVIVVEHVMALVMGVSDRILVIDRGRLIALGTPDEIRANDDVIAAYLGGTEE
ncbi:ABC transporter ATP-binding protein [Nocardioides terrisoli]|uniref:ABC transporter ATP-binding protein n=1 Tax=Nocardioides terrisoli TaxID=3388267 RepID=UPI00287B9B83|nr:ABC transporter ATP-binding protein [Nocardioides marmorisolisilvae]